MKSKQIFINMESDKYNLIVEARDVSKIIYVSPLCVDLGTTLIRNNDKIMLEFKDEITCYFLGDRKVISHFYSPNIFSKTAKLIIPNDYIVNLNINLENGSIFLKDLVFDKVNLASIRGNILMDNCNGGIALIDGYKSNVSLKSVVGSDCIVHTKTGDVSLEDNTVTNAEIKTEIGNIKLNASQDFLKNTNIIFSTKSLKKGKLQAQEEKKKRLVLCAPYGEVDSNIF